MKERIRRLEEKLMPSEVRLPWVCLQHPVTGELMPPPPDGWEENFPAHLPAIIGFTVAGSGPPDDEKGEAWEARLMRDTGKMPGFWIEPRDQAERERRIRLCQENGVQYVEPEPFDCSGWELPERIGE